MALDIKTANVDFEGRGVVATISTNGPVLFRMGRKLFTALYSPCATESGRGASNGGFDEDKPLYSPLFSGVDEIISAVQ